MAQPALRVCPEGGCNELTRGGRCDKHRRTDRQREYERTPERMADDRWYHRQVWKRLRAAKLNDDPLCVLCQEQGRTVVATEVDHIIDRKERPDLALDWDNLQGLCKSCHSGKTARTQRRGVGA